jgi:hypothetical protein
MDDYRDYRTDPDDATLVAYGYDHTDPGWGGIGSATLSVWTNEEGRHWLTVSIAPLSWANTGIRLDTDGDRAAEFVIGIFESFYCQISGQGRSRSGHYYESSGSPDTYDDGFYACHVPLSFVKPSARIAWRVRTWSIPSTSEESTYTDRAPNVGWYV